MKKLCVLLLICFICPGVFAQANTDANATQDTTKEEINTGQDITKPLSRFDIRYKYQQTTGRLDTSLMTFRLDVPFKFKSGWQLSTRFDLPLVYSDVPSRDNPRGDYEFGTGDFLTQFLFIAPPKGRWVYAFGTQVLWPTGSQDQMGTGKYQLVPTMAAVYYPERWSKGSFAAVVIRDGFDIAGKDDRKHIHELYVQPMVNFNLPERWFLTLAPEMKMNWEDDNKWFVPFDVTLGKMLNKSTVASLGFKQAMVNDYDLYDWEIEFRIGFFF